MIALSQVMVRKAGQIILSLESAEIPAGARLLVRGQNGAGKTTLLRVLAGLEPLTAGSIAGLPQRSASVLVHQAPFVFRGSLRENVALGLPSRPLTKSARDERLAAILAEFQLQDLADRPASLLSGGERRRLALARALVLEPQLLLLDEPLADLDAAGREALERSLLARPALTVVTASPVELPKFLAQETLELCGHSERN